MSWVNRSVRKVGVIGGTTVWDDLRSPASGLNPAGSISPPSVNTADGSLTFATGNAVGVWFQLPHDYKEGSTVSVHCHWSKSTSAAGTVNWQVKTKWFNIGATDPGFSALASGTDVVPDSSTAGKQALTSFGDLVGTGKTLSSMICVYLVRTAAGDSYGANVNLYEIDVHYQRDTLGSRERFIK